MGGLLRYCTPGWRHSQVPVRSAGAASAVLATQSAARHASFSRLMTISLVRSPAIVDRHPALIFGAGVVRARADDFTVYALLDDMRGPAGSARDHEDGREHRGRHAHAVVRHRAVPVEIREHLLLARHHLLDALGDVEELRVARGFRQ